MTTRSNTILLVDDDPKTLDLVSFILREEGFEVMTAPDGRLALDAVAQQTPALVLTDLNMPFVTGWEVLAEVHAREPGVPVLLVTAQTSSEARAQAAAMGAADYITKPIDLDALLACVRRHMLDDVGSGSSV